MKYSLIGFDNCSIFLRKNIFYSYPFSDLYSSALCFFRQPVIELIAADDAQRVPLRDADVQSLRFKIKMDALHIHVRHFADIEPEPLEDDLCVEHKTACAKFGARVTRFFQDQDSGRGMRSDPL